MPLRARPLRAREAFRRTAAVLIGGLALAVVGCATSSSPGEGAAPTAPATTAPTTMPGAAGPPPAADEPAMTTTRVPPDGDPAPDFTLDLAEGGEFTLSEAGKPVYLLFWAEWCPICSREMPVIDAVASDYLDEITFVAVAGRSSLEASRGRVGDWFSPDRLLWGYDDDLWTTYSVRGQPVSFVISSDGVIVGQWFGAIGEDALRDRLDDLVVIG